MKFETPFFVTLACAFSWGILTVCGRILLLEYHFAPATFTFIQMLSGGLALVLLGRKRFSSIGLRPLKYFHTWAFGGLRIISASFYVASLLYISATNLAFLGAIAITMSVLYVWLTLKRKPKLIELPGHIIILIALYFMIMQFDGQFNNPAVWLLFSSEVIITIAITIGERHPMNQSNNSGDTLYLTGMILLASATILLFLSYIAFTFEAQLPADFYPQIRSQISRFALKDILNAYAWMFGFLIGASFRAAAIYYSLRSVKLTSSEFYLGSMALMPYINLAFEHMAMKWGLLPVVEFNQAEFLLGTIACAASLYIIYFKRGKN